MAFRIYPFTEKKLEKWIKEGRGQGLGASYVPWLQEGDVPTAMGAKSRGTCSKSGRRTIVFSDVEHYARHYYEAKAIVIGIEEQFPLDRATTRRIARSLGIVHPRDPRSGVDIVMTTDLVVRYIGPDGSSVRAPRSCKSHSSLGDFNDAEHAEIERRYWAEEGEQWRLLVDGDVGMTPVLKENLDLLFAYRFVPEGPQAGLFDLQCSEVIFAMESSRHPHSLEDLCRELDSRRGYVNGSSMRAALFLVHKQVLFVDLHQQPLLDVPLSRFRVITPNLNRHTFTAAE